MLPPTPDTLPFALEEDKTEIANAILTLINDGLVTHISFHNQLVFTPYGLQTFKSRFIDEEFKGGSNHGNE